MPTDFEAESTASRADVAAVLSDVVDGLNAGRIHFRSNDGDAVSVAVPEELTLEVECERDGDERSLELELEWPETSAPVEERDPERDDATPDAEPAVEDVPLDADAEPAVEDVPLDADAEPAVEGVPIGAGAATTTLARFEVFRDRGDEWRWRLRHRNGNIVATSGEGYGRKRDARRGLQSVVANAPGAAVTEEQEP